jgi:hypothetical protein
MTTNWWGRTLVFVNKWAETVDVRLSPLNTYSNEIKRDYINSTNVWTTRAAQYWLIENWPYYNELYRERWLPSSLTSRTYIINWFWKTNTYKISNSTTNINYLSSKRTNTQWWNFIMNPNPPPSYITTPNWTPLYRDWCSWCMSGFMYVPLWSWNWFFPDYTYWYWRISDWTTYSQQRTDYNNLQNWNPMPWYWLYIR